MDFNTILYRLGLDPSCFENRLIEPIQTEKGFIWEVYQRRNIRVCPRCGSVSGYIQDHSVIDINCNETDQIKDTLRIHKIRFKCRDCGITYTPAVEGLERYKTISSQTLRLITGDFNKKISFTDIANRYGLSLNRVIQLFDEKVPFIPRGRLPIALCIDEIYFKSDDDQKYCCVLYDHNKDEIVDMIQSRQMPYLVDYFSSISEKERENVQFFISDMYDSYRTIKNRFFKYSVHIVDLFHVVSLLTNAVSQIRYKFVKDTKEQSFYINFMKTHYKCFLCRRKNIPDKWYEPKGYGKAIHYSDMVFACVKKDSFLLEAYNILQDLYNYNRNDTFTESLNFVRYISNRLKSSKNELLNNVGKSYTKWEVEIANGLAKNQTNHLYSNGIAEQINNELKSIIKFSYGYRNFDRFRRRSMLISRYKKS